MERIEAEKILDKMAFESYRQNIDGIGMFSYEIEKLTEAYETIMGKLCFDPESKNRINKFNGVEIILQEIVN